MTSSEFSRSRRITRPIQIQRVREIYSTSWWENLGSQIAKGCGCGEVNNYQLFPKIYHNFSASFPIRQQNVAFRIYCGGLTQFLSFRGSGSCPQDWTLLATLESRPSTPCSFAKSSRLWVSSVPAALFC